MFPMRYGYLHTHTPEIIEEEETKPQIQKRANRASPQKKFDEEEFPSLGDRGDPQIDEKEERRLKQIQKDHRRLLFGNGNQRSNILVKRRKKKAKKTKPNTQNSGQRTMSKVNKKKDFPSLGSRPDMQKFNSSSHQTQKILKSYKHPKFDDLSELSSHSEREATPEPVRPKFENQKKMKKVNNSDFPSLPMGGNTAQPPPSQTNNLSLMKLKRGGLQPVKKKNKKKKKKGNKGKMKISMIPPGEEGEGRQDDFPGLPAKKEEPKKVEEKKKRPGFKRRNIFDEDDKEEDKVVKKPMKPFAIKKRSQTPKKIDQNDFPGLPVASKPQKSNRNKKKGHNRKRSPSPQEIDESEFPGLPMGSKPKKSNKKKAQPEKQKFNYNEINPFAREDRDSSSSPEIAKKNRKKSYEEPQNLVVNRSKHVGKPHKKKNRGKKKKGGEADFPSLPFGQQQEVSKPKKPQFTGFNKRVNLDGIINQNVDEEEYPTMGGKAKRGNGKGKGKKKKKKKIIL